MVGGNGLHYYGYRDVTGVMSFLVTGLSSTCHTLNPGRFSSLYKPLKMGIF